jgi:hypothetical protein
MNVSGGLKSEMKYWKPLLSGFLHPGLTIWQAPTLYFTNNYPPLIADFTADRGGGERGKEGIFPLQRRGWPNRSTVSRFAVRVPRLGRPKGEIVRLGCRKWVSCSGEKGSLDDVWILKTECVVYLCMLEKRKCTVQYSFELDQLKKAGTRDYWAHFLPVE